MKTRSALRVVGKIGDATVYDLEYIFSGDEPGSRVRTVLIETAANQLHEIHVRGNLPQGTLLPTEITSGPLSVIKIKFDDGGIYHFVNEDYYVVSADGALLLDFEPVFQSVSKAIPSDMVTWQPTSRFDFSSQVFHIRTERQGSKVGCCEGRVEVPFRIEKGRVVAGDAKYYP